jgi:hypothetical protein
VCDDEVVNVILGERYIPVVFHPCQVSGVHENLVLSSTIFEPRSNYPVAHSGFRLLLKKLGKSPFGERVHPLFLCHGMIISSIGATGSTGATWPGGFRRRALRDATRVDIGSESAPP